MIGGRWLPFALIGILVAITLPTRADESLSAPAATVQLKIELASPGRLPWVVFDERQGLPQHTIVDLLTDQRGFVWAATQDGLARYNGRGWEAISLPPQMHSNFPRVVRRASDGGLWVGSFDGGLAHLKDDAWNVIDRHDGLPSNRVRGLLETKDAHGMVLWIATDKGVARLQGGKIKVFDLSSGLPSLDTEALLEATDANGQRSLLVGTSNGMARLVGDRFVVVPVPKALLGHRIDDMVESPGLHGGPALWIASYGAGMGVFENGQWTLLDTGSGLPSNVEVFSASHAADGSPALWIGSEGGLLRFEHGRFTLYDERSGLPIRIIWKVLETSAPDGLNTLWLGTWGGGVVRLSPNAWTGFDASSGMPTGAVTSVLLSRDDNDKEVVWAGTSDGELAKFAGERFEAVPLPETLRHTIIFSLLETRAADGTRTLWVSSFGGGIGQLTHGHWTVMAPATLPNQRVYQLLETRDDGGSVFWAATEGGLGRLAHGRWTVYSEATGLPSDIVTQVLETAMADGRRVVWAGTSKGLARLENGNGNVFKRESDLASDNISSLQLVTDAEGVRWLWAGTLAGGAFRLPIDSADAHWQAFTLRSSPPLPSNTVQSIANDQLGRIYLCTTRGVARLTPRRPSAANPDSFSEDVFTSEDGLPSSDCQQGARMVDDHGRVWFGTARGLGMFDPRTEQADVLPKPLRIERAELSDHSRVLHGGESLSYSERNLNFSVALLAYSAESRIRYRFQLAGFDPKPSEWAATSTKEYTNLGAGDYQFKVWGKDARGNVSGPVSLAFTVRPAPWLTAWAFAVYVLLAAAFAYGVLQWRLRALARRTRELESIVAERTHDLVVARDEMQRMATEDALTGVANRRKYNSILDQEWRRAQREGHRLTLVLIDVDFFKRYNDHYGHAAGDACLRAVAQAVTGQCVRPMDLVARYGGEEFAMVLPDSSPDGVGILLGSVLGAVDALQIAHADSSCAPYVTISMGAVTLVPGRNDGAETALKRVDQLLYKAKESGRHQAMYEREEGQARPIVAGNGAGQSATLNS